MDAAPATPNVGGGASAAAYIADESGSADEPPLDAVPSRRSLRRRDARADEPVAVDVVVVGAGQAGLSAAYHLRRSGLTPVGEPGWERARGTFVVLDDAPHAGGAWQHRWPGLRMADAHAVHDLPGMPLVVPDPQEPAALAVPYYYAQYEEEFGLRVQRPVRVDRVRDDGRGGLLVSSRSVEHPSARVVWRARGLVNATGTWQKPFWPAYPGRATFAGRQLHTHDYRRPEDLADGHVVVVGAGTSAVQLLLQVARVTTTTWVTRRPPVWRDAEFSPELGREAVAKVEQRTRAGLPPRSVVSVTGIALTPAYREGIASGVLRARPMFSRIVPDGVVWEQRPAGTADGAGDGIDAVDVTTTGAVQPATTGAVHPTTGAVRAAPTGAVHPATTGAVHPAATGAQTRTVVGATSGATMGTDADDDWPDLAADVPSGWVDGPPHVAARTLLWCTGFRAALDHLAPLHLRGRNGGIVMDGTQVVADPRIQLVGYGPSASTIGANRAGREAVRNLRRLLGW